MIHHPYCLVQCATTLKHRHISMSLQKQRIVSPHSPMLKLLGFTGYFIKVTLSSDILLLAFHLLSSLLTPAEPAP